MIKKITIGIGEKEIELTESEAMQLKDEIEKVFGKSSPDPVLVPFVVTPQQPWTPQYPYEPIITYGNDTLVSGRITN